MVGVGDGKLREDGELFEDIVCEVMVIEYEVFEWGGGG